jgi:hypothetical protein
MDELEDPMRASEELEDATVEIGPALIAVVNAVGAVY